VRFNHDLLADRYEHVMLIDGNDTRGIDVGIMTTAQVEILCSRSNVDTPDPGRPESDCSAGTAPSTSAGSRAAPPSGCS
jgi:hypothetical protein